PPPRHYRQVIAFAVSRIRMHEGAIALVGRYMAILAVAGVVGCAVAPAPTTPDAANPAVVGSPGPPATATDPSADKLVEQSVETRFQLDLRVPEAALAQFMPSGWSSYVEASGAARDANLRIIFIDRLTVNSPTGQPLGTNGNRLVQLVAPIKNQSSTTAMLVIGGLTEDPADVPGPFGNYLQAGTHKVTRSTADTGVGADIDATDWVFE